MTPSVRLLSRAATLVLAMTATLAVSITSADAATKTIGNPVCFSDLGGVCTPIGNGKSVRLVVHPGGYAGAYFNAKNTQGKAPAGVDYSFDYTGSTSGGAPRFSIPIDQNGDGTAEGYAFIDPNSCGQPPTGSGTVSTTSSACGVYYGANYYANWDAFSAAAAAGGWTIAKKDSPFLIADWEADVVISNIAFVVD